jgi:hypothetical protein
MKDCRASESLQVLLDKDCLWQLVRKRTKQWQPFDLFTSRRWRICKKANQPSCMHLPKSRQYYCNDWPATENKLTELRMMYYQWKYLRQVWSLRLGCLEIAEGNSLEAIIAWKTQQNQESKGNQFALHTEMGNGVDFMMYSHAWHGKAPNDATRNCKTITLRRKY